MYINSPGGSFTSLMAIYDTMQYVRPDIHDRLPRPGRLGRGGAARRGHPRQAAALPNARILIHQPATEGI